MKTSVKKSKFDDVIFYWYNNNMLEGSICCGVDDLFWEGAKHFPESVINRLKKNDLTVSEEFENCKYVGLNLVQKDSSFYIDQQLYIDELKEVVILKNRKFSKGSPLTDEARQLRGLLAKSNWASIQTRPDIRFGACEVSTSIKDAQIGDLVNANKNIRKLRSKMIREFSQRK